MFSCLRSNRVVYSEIQGFADGVPAYSNGNDEYFSGKKHYVRYIAPTMNRQIREGQGRDAVCSDGADREMAEEQIIFTGYQWQCVEFARRWLLATKGLLLPDVPNAARVFDMSRVIDLRSSAHHHGGRSVSAPMIAVPNGGAVKPSAGSLLIWPQAHGAPFGHIGVIVEVTDSTVRIADQNQHFHDWRASGFSAELRLERDERRDTWTVRDRIYGRTWYPLGWMVFPC